MVRGLPVRKFVQLVTALTFQVDIGWLSAVAPLDRLLIFVTVYLLAFVYVCNGRALVLVAFIHRPSVSLSWRRWRVRLSAAESPKHPGAVVL